VSSRCMEIRQRACLGVKQMLVALNVWKLRDAKSEIRQERGREF
jgi:hypothetical protein